MFRQILTMTLVLVSTFLISQQYTSSSIPIFKNPEFVNIFDANGKLVAEMQRHYKSKMFKKEKKKSFTFNTEEYTIVKTKGKEKVYAEDMTLVAEMKKNGAHIVLMNADKVFKRKRSFISYCMTYQDKDGVDILSSNFKTKISSRNT